MGAIVEVVGSLTLRRGIWSFLGVESRRLLFGR